jgi:pimeloyl-ACP methyl ester carboxylesterase
MSSAQVRPAAVAGFPAIATAGAPGRPPLLFIHGSFATHRCFAAWMELLAARGWGGVAAARRGRHGLAPERARGLTIADYLADTIAVMAAMDHAPVLVGHSLGGLIAQKIAERGRCRALVLLAPAPAAMLTAQAVALPWLLPMLPGIFSGRSIIPSRRAAARIALNRTPEPDRRRIHGALVRESGQVYREMLLGAVKVDAAGVSCPVLVVGGHEDRIISRALLKRTAARYRAWLDRTILADVAAERHAQSVRRR